MNIAAEMHPLQTRARAPAAGPHRDEREEATAGTMDLTTQQPPRVGGSEGLVSSPAGSAAATPEKLQASIPVVLVSYASALSCRWRLMALSALGSGCGDAEYARGCHPSQALQRLPLQWGEPTE